MNYRKWLYSGITIFIVSVLIGVVGTVQGVYSSFDALERAESAGIGPVGAGIQNALIFTIVGLVGSALGLILLGVGALKAYRSKTAATSPTD